MEFELLVSIIYPSQWAQGTLVNVTAWHYVFIVGLLRRQALFSRFVSVRSSKQQSSFSVQTCEVQTENDKAQSMILCVSSS
jgi:hypothetical protein